MIRIIKASQLKGEQYASLSFDDNRGKVIAEGVIGGTLILGFAALLVANFANRLSKDEDTSHQYHPVQLPTLDNGALEAKMTELARLYHQR